MKNLRAQFDLKDVVRTNENRFKELGLSLDNEMQVLQAMVKEPILIKTHYHL